MSVNDICETFLSEGLRGSVEVKNISVEKISKITFLSKVWQKQYKWDVRVL